MTETASRRNFEGRYSNALVNVILTYSRLLSDSRLSQTKFLSRYADPIRKVFSTPIEKGAVPVLICAWNEVDSLPMLFRALAHSTVSVKPVVVDNNSTDGTGDLARDLGAEVIEEKSQGLMPAQITGFRYLVQKNIRQFGITDSDSAPVPTWIANMKKSAASIDNLGGGMIIGSSIYHGDLIRDTARNISEESGSLIYLAHNRVTASGPNGFIKFGINDDIRYQLTKKLNPDIVWNQDRYLRDNVIAANGEVRKNLSPEAWVLTQGDRYPSLLALFKSPPYGRSNMELYDNWIKQNPNGIVYKSSYDLWGGK